MPKNTSNAPEAVMRERRISSPEVKTVNRNLFFYMRFKFYRFDRRTVYSISNDFRDLDRGQGFAEDDSTVAAALAAAGLDRSQIRDYRNEQLAAENAATSENRMRQMEYNRQVLTQPLSTVVLPIPPELHEQYSVDFQQAGIGLVGKTLIDMNVSGAVQGALSGDMGAFSGSAEAGRRMVTTVVGNLIEALPENMQSTAEIARGKIKNPVYTTVFRGVPIRSHEFSWKIAPESQQEQIDIEAVLKALRKHTLPPFERSGEINNIMYPDFCMIDIEPRVIKFPKPMFVTSLAINHAPEGIPAFFHDKTPVGYEIKMRLTEAMALTREDIIEDEEEQQTT